MTQTREITGLHRVRVSVDLGASSEMRQVTAAVRDMGALAAFAEAVASPRAQAQIPIVFVREPEEPPGGQVSIEARSDWLARAARQWLAVTGPSFNLPASQPSFQMSGRESIRVESMTYRNPIEWVLIGGLGLAVFRSVVLVLREASDAYHEHQRNQIGTDEYRDLATQRTRIRQHVTDALIHGDRELDPQMIERVLTDPVADAAIALSQRPLEVQTLPPG